MEIKKSRSRPGCVCCGSPESKSLGCFILITEPLNLQPVKFMSKYV